MDDATRAHLVRLVLQAVSMSAQEYHLGVESDEHPLVDNLVGEVYGTIDDGWRAIEAEAPNWRTKLLGMCYGALGILDGPLHTIGGFEDLRDILKEILEILLGEVWSKPQKD